MSTIGLPIHYINLINKSIEKEIEEEKDPPIHIGGGTGKWWNQILEWYTDWLGLILCCSVLLLQ